MNTDLKRFLKNLFIVSLPIIIQELLANLSALIDTLMVGRLEGVANASVSGVYIATQILFIVNLMIYGSIEGGSVFFSQFFGIKDKEGMRNSFGFKLIASTLLSTIATIILLIFGRNFVEIFTSKKEVINIALGYINIVAFSVIPFAIATTISSTLREYHKGLSPLIITLVAVIFNIIINYICIFGKLGIPRLEGVGAAIGTLVERYVRLILLIIVLLKNKYPFTKKLLDTFKMDKTLLKRMIIKSIPLLFNELLWSFSQTLLVFFFNEKDSIATTVLPMAQTIFNLIFVILLGLGNAYSILLANTIGQNDFKKAQKEAYITVIITTIVCFFLGTVLFISSNLITSLYSEVDLETRTLATKFIKFCAFYMLINGINTNIFFLLRAGGKTGIVLFFDAFYGYIISLPFAALICYSTNLNLLQMYGLVYGLDVIKFIIGFILIISKKWCKNLTNYENKNMYLD